MIEHLLDLVTACVAAWGAYMIGQAKKDIHKVELATNSMKDALVAATGEKQFLAGQDKGRIEGEVKAAQLAQGKEAERLESEKKVTIVADVIAKPKTTK